jgi:hypothetical protein
MKKIILMVMSVFLLGSLMFVPSSIKRVQSAGYKPYVLVISVDACRADYLDQVDMPNFKILASSGSTFSNAWVGQLRNDTPPGHTTIATGSFPKNDGILGFSWKDPKTNKVVNVTSWEAVTAGLMTKTIQQSGCTSIGSIVKSSYPDAKVVAISSNKYYAAAALGAQSADYIIFNKNDKSSDKKTKGAKTLELAGVKGFMPPQLLLDDPSFKRSIKNPTDGDTWATDVAIRILELVKPQVILLNLPLTDEAGHASGGITKMEVMSPVLKNVDVQLGKLIDAYKKAGIFDQTLFVVTSDHGMTPRLKTIDDTILKNILTGQVAFPGGRADYYLNIPGNAWFIAEMISAYKIEGIDAVYYKTTNEKGAYVYNPTVTATEVLSKELISCYRYLGATYASAKSPDLILITKENWKFGNSKMVGDHGQATWDNQHIPLLFAGLGVKKGVSDGSARLVDIAPTIIALMGLKPDKMDGIVLADILQTPTSKDLEKLATLNKWLKPLMQAFKDISLKNK